MIQNLTATNSQGLSLIFDESFRVTSGLDLSGLAAEINSVTTNRAGSSYQNTRLLERTINLEFQIRRKFQDEATMDDVRQRMYQVFTPETEFVRFDFNLANGEAYYFTAHPTSAPVMPPNKGDNNSAYQLALVQLICNDPYIYQTNGVNVEAATINGGFIFPLEIPQGVGIEMGSRSESLVVNVENRGTGDVGMVIKFSAIANDVTNPELINVNTGELIALNFNMMLGDEITINTTRGQRRITLKRNNITTNIFNSLRFRDSTFFQLHPGDNILRYNASNNINSLVVNIEFNNRYVGV